MPEPKSITFYNDSTRLNDTTGERLLSRTYEQNA